VGFFGFFFWVAILGGYFGWVFYCQPCMKVDLAGGATGEPTTAGGESTAKLVVCGVTCLPQRAALLKSMLNFLKKAIQGWESHKEPKSRVYRFSIDF
jgi:hypothetical protein